MSSLFKCMPNVLTFTFCVFCFDRSQKGIFVTREFVNFVLNSSCENVKKMCLCVFLLKKFTTELYFYRFSVLIEFVCCSLCYNI